MSVHIVDDEQRSDRRAIPTRPSGSGRRGGICGVGAPRRCTPTSPASRRLASAHAALGTRCLLILGQAPWSLSTRLLKMDPEMIEQVKTKAQSHMAELKAIF